MSINASFAQRLFFQLNFGLTTHSDNVLIKIRLTLFGIQIELKQVEAYLNLKLVSVKQN